MKFEDKHINATVNDIPSQDTGIGLWKVLKIHNYYTKINLEQKQKVLIELIEIHRDTFFKIGDKYWVPAEQICFSEDYIVDQQTKILMNRIGYEE